MKRLAHRGYSDLFPENTMSAFEKAVNSSFEGIETDVQMTIDGELLLLHDDKINRTSNGKGVLRNMTFKEARQYNYNNKMDITEQIPTLDSLLTLLDSTDKLLNIEIKDTVSSGLEEKLRDVVITIPGTINDLPVTEIGPSAFGGYRYINYIKYT